MSKDMTEYPKTEALKKEGIYNHNFNKVEDELFHRHDFFDSQDLLQVKYEMVRRVQKDGWTIAKAAKVFGFSRPSFYEAQTVFNKSGLPGLIPGQRGPKTAYKLSDKVMKFIDNALVKNKTLRATELAALIEKNFGLKVHPRSVERALIRAEKKRRKKHAK